ncbi:MAG: PIN domain-containing protein [Acidimicrobiia bacterium]
MILDTSGLIAAFLVDQRLHQRCAEALLAANRRILSPFVIAELDYLASTRSGVSAELAILDELASDSYSVATVDAGFLRAAIGVIEQYRDLGVGLADASLVVLADRHETRDIFTLDERHFRAMKGLDGRPFRLVPLDT